MNEATVIDFAMQSIVLVLVVSLPPIIVATVVGLLISFIQAVTQLQDQTLSFGVKLIAVTITMLLLGSWMAGQVYTYSLQLFDSFATISY
ncbi:MAG: type III secretion system export apparatus subunit SctS [Desulfovibrionaceae bacterium]